MYRMRCTVCQTVFETSKRGWETGTSSCPKCANTGGSLVEASAAELHQPGLKFDDGKALPVKGALHYFPRAILAVAEHSKQGAVKYTWSGWETVPDGIERYTEALGRHLLALKTEGERDPEGFLHVTAIAWNALAVLELTMRKQ